MDPSGWGSSWTNQEELLAAIAELVSQSNTLFIQANSKKGARPPKPLRIPRPGDEKPKPATGEELKTFMERKGAPLIVREGD